MSNKGKLFLIPTAIAANTNELTVTPQVKFHLKEIHHFLAEDIRTARRFLSSLKIYDSIEDLSFSVLNKDTREDELEALVSPVLSGSNLGILSESGCPGVADPGALAVGYAHKKGITVIPLVGPSSILLALMASGLNGQHFAFHGYLPIRDPEVSKAIRAYEKESRTKAQTQIFIETPYRNDSLFSALIRTLAPETILCVARDVTGEHELIRTQPVWKWRDQSIELGKHPTVFLFLA
jgi:Predicted methyltransferases